MRLSRLPLEQYPYNPFFDQLTVPQWDEVNRKDAAYRARLSKYLQAFLRGGTNEGIAMAAEAACGAPCQVVEVWRITSNLGIASVGRLNAAKEFVIVPHTTDLTLDEERAIYHAVGRLKPANTVCTVDPNGLNVLTIVSIRYAVSPSEYFEVRKYVTYPGQAPIPDSQRQWLQPGQEVEAPTYANLRTMEEEWSLNQSVASVSSYRLFAGYPQRIGILTADYAAGDPQMHVSEETEPPTVSFQMMVDDEVFLVTGRTATGSTEHIYDVTPAQDNTPSQDHPARTIARAQYVSLASPPTTDAQHWGPWRAVETADSPDNYPDGFYAGDPGKYDERGAYIFSWQSQAQYVAWFLNQLMTIGGEINADASLYRLPITMEETISPGSSVENALGEPQFRVLSTYYPVQ